jgi:hypothetical protein
MSLSWARICAPGIEATTVESAFEAPNHYLKLTAREQLFAWLHGGETEIQVLYWNASDLSRTATRSSGADTRWAVPPIVLVTRQNRASRSNSSQGGEPTGSPLATRVMRINGRHP